MELQKWDKKWQEMHVGPTLTYQWNFEYLVPNYR